MKRTISVFTMLGLTLLSGCGGGGSEGTNSNNNPATGYVVYKKTTLSGKASGGELSYAAMPVPAESSQVVVLPASEAAPANYNAVANANVTFTQQEAISDSDTVADSVTVTADANGRFDIPYNIKNGYSSDDGDIEVAVSVPGGNTPASDTVLTVAGDDNSGESPLSLKIVPDEFRMRQDEIKVFHAVKVMPGGNSVKAKNATWDCTGALTKVQEAADGSYVVCKAVTTGDASINVSINAGGGLSYTANGEVYSNNLIFVSGKIFSSYSSTAPVGKGYLVSFNLPSRNGVVRTHFSGLTDDTGSYKVDLPPTTETFHVLIGIPQAQGGRLFKADPLTVNFPSSDLPQAAIGKDFRIGEPLLPHPRRLPIAGIIGRAWRQVLHAALPRLYEPFNGIRYLLSDAVSDGKNNSFGLFNNWCYSKSESMVTLTPAAGDSCPNPNPPLKLEITKSSPTQFYWNIYRQGLSGTYAKIDSGQFADTWYYPLGGTPYISEIKALGFFHNPIFPDRPVLTISSDWNRTLGTDSESDVIPSTINIAEKVCSGNNVWTGSTAASACGTGWPVAADNLTRKRDVAFTSLTSTGPLLNFYGDATHYFKRLDGTLAQINHSVCSDTIPCVINTDGSGNATVASADGRLNIQFSIQPWKGTGDAAATGTLTLKVKMPDGEVTDRIFTFTIGRNGVITVIGPNGAFETFHLPM